MAVRAEADAAERIYSPRKAFEHVVFCAVNASMVVGMHFAGHHSAASPSTTNSAMSHSARAVYCTMGTACFAFITLAADALDACQTLQSMVP